MCLVPEPLVEWKIHNEVLDTRIYKLTIKIQDELLFGSKAWVRIRDTSGMSSVKSLSTNTLSSPAKDTTTPTTQPGLVCCRCCEYGISIHPRNTVSDESRSANLNNLRRLGVYKSYLIVLLKGKVTENLHTENRKRSLSKVREVRCEYCW